MSLVRSIKSLLAGRWQVPVGVLAIAAAGFALLRVKPPPREVNFDSLLVDVVALMEGKAYYDAANAAANLLEMQPPLTRLQQGILHEKLAEIAFRVESLREEPDAENLRLLLQHQDDAIAHGVKSDVRFAQRAAQSHEWLGQMSEAIEAHKLVLERRPSDQGRRDSLQALVRLLEGRPGADEQRRLLIERLLSEEGVSPAYVWAALQHALREALERDDFARAQALLERHANRFTRSDLKGYHDYLWAWLNVAQGRDEEAQPLIDWVDEWLVSHHGVDPEMDRAGFLPALNRWLRGRIELADDRPQEALRYFDEVAALQSHGTLFIENALFRATAMARIERHAAAGREVREGLVRLSRDAAALHAGMPRLRRAMLGLSAERQECGDAENAVAYLALALELTPTRDAPGRLDLLERLGRECEDGAARARHAGEERDFLLESGRYFALAAPLAALDADRHAALLWSSAQAFDRAGRSDEARRMLVQFVEARSDDPRLAPALLQLGQACAADGELVDALNWYQRLIGRFPVLDEASRARLLSADALLMLGDERKGEAEALLRGLLEDPRLAPASQTFRDALFNLCDLLYHQGRYADAISGMEDFLAFYPRDAERDGLRFLLADAHRRSALALRERPPAGASLEAVRKESGLRFRRAAELFSTFDADEEPTGRESALRRRLALFYRADCLVELNTPDSLDEALALYRQAAALFQATPAALTAQVQIANVLLRQGKPTEAARSVERARWLLRGMAETAFDPSSGLGREHWDRFLTTVASSQLFTDMFAESR